MATTVTFRNGDLLINNDGRVAVLPVPQLQLQDADIDAVIARAQAQPGTAVTVPAVSFARGLRPRNYGAYGVAQ